MSQKIFALKGKTAVVTGGAGYLGSAICEVLAGAGADVVIGGKDAAKAKRKASELEKEYGIKSFGIVMDISSEKSVAKAFKDIKNRLGRIDILVNNAYFCGGGWEIEHIQEKDWLKGIDGTINGVFRCTKAVIPYMKKAGDGSIINISSMYGVVSPDPSAYGDTGLNNPPQYGAGKAAILQFTRFSACHLADKNIRVNSIMPGAFPNHEVRKKKDFVKKLEKKIPLGRVGQPDDLKGAVLFLASNASKYMTGANMIVDGGWTAW